MNGYTSDAHYEAVLRATWNLLPTGAHLTIVDANGKTQEGEKVFAYQSVDEKVHVLTVRGAEIALSDHLVLTLPE